MPVGQTLATAAAILMATASAVFAQNGAVTGKVVLAGSKEAIEGVTVSVQGTRASTRSAPNGSFSILGVPPGTYTVSARLVGYASVEIRGVEVLMDRTREVNFTLRQSRTDSVEVINFDPDFIDPSIGTSLITLSAEKVISLPSVTLPGALGVNGGYLQLPRSGTNLSLSDFRRGISNLPTVRGARPEATLYMLDGIEVNNPLFGFLPILAEPMATSAVSFSPAHVDAEYGGALSGLVSQALREGGDQLAGAFEYQTAAIAGLFGAEASRASSASAIRGYLSGPMPIRPDAFRFSVAGHFLGDRTGVVRTGDAWRGSGDNAHEQGIAKLTYSVSPGFRLSLSGLAQRRTAIDVDPGFVGGDSAAPGTMREDTRLVIARAEKRFARSHFSVAFANTSLRRETCSIWEGICIEDRLQRVASAAETPFGGAPPRGTPYALTGQLYGGEQYRTNTLRADLVLQATDHNQVKAGMYTSRHDIDYADVIGYRIQRESVEGREVAVVGKVRDVYRAKPVEFATYVQNVFEHDLITIHLGIRYDYTKSPGIGFTNTLDPTNGTTAREVCDGNAPGINEVPFRYLNETGLGACFEELLHNSSRLIDSATRLAQSDDYRASLPRSAFSPRIGISLPITGQSALFVNFGRYARNPLYHDMYRYSGTGTRAGMSGDGDGMCESVRARPGSSECNPLFSMPTLFPEFIGNPLLPYQVATQWETGFTSALGRFHSIDVSFFSNDIDHLPTVISQPQVPDPGATYGGVGDRPIRAVLSTGWLSSMGVSVTIRRQLHDAFAYSFNYTYERSSEAGARPDLVAEALAGGQQVDTRSEHATSRNRPHLFNAEASMQWRDNVPRALGRAGRIVLGNSRTAATITAASGSRSRLSSGDCTPLTPCGLLARRVNGTRNLVNLMYSKSLTTRLPQWALVLRVQNLLDADDGSGALASLPFLSGGVPPTVTSGRSGPAFRRILSGMAVTF
jgi:hypothetical protein